MAACADQAYAILRARGLNAPDGEMYVCAYESSRKELVHELLKEAAPIDAGTRT